MIRADWPRITPTRKTMMRRTTAAPIRSAGLALRAAAEVGFLGLRQALAALDRRGARRPNPLQLDVATGRAVRCGKGLRGHRGRVDDGRQHALDAGAAEALLVPQDQTVAQNRLDEALHV